jgi:hypothetical protein
VSELTKRLEELYKEVKTKKSSSVAGGKDVQILTGPRKGSSSSPTATPKATVKPSSSPTASSSATTQ